MIDRPIIELTYVSMDPNGGQQSATAKGVTAERARWILGQHKVIMDS
jgi:hypothetical protein